MMLEVLLGATTILSAILVTVASVSYLRTRGPGLLFVCGAFGAFLLKNLLQTLALFERVGDTWMPSEGVVALDLGILLLLYLMTLGPRPSDPRLEDDLREVLKAAMTDDGADDEA